MTKAEQRVRYTEAIENLSSAMKQSSVYENAFFKSQTDLTKFMIEKEKSNENRASLKRKLEEIEIEKKTKETIQTELNNLLWLKNNNILTEAEFIKQCKKVAGI